MGSRDAPGGDGSSNACGSPGGSGNGGNKAFGDQPGVGGSSTSVMEAPARAAQGISNVDGRKEVRGLELEAEDASPGTLSAESRAAKQKRDKKHLDLGKQRRQRFALSRAADRQGRWRRLAE